MSGSSGNQLVLFSRESWCFPRRSRGKHQDSRENKTNWFPKGPDIKCFVIFRDFHFNSNKRITGANQSTRHLQEHKFNSQNHWMNDLQSTFLILSASFPCTSCCLSSGITLKIVFSLRLPGCVVVFINEKENNQCFSRLLSRHFPPCLDHVP